MVHAHIFFIYVILTLASSLAGFTSHHFYRASFLPDEPRLETPFLSSFKTRLVAGTTCRSFDCQGCTAPLFAIDPCVRNALIQTNLIPRLIHGNCLRGRFDIFEADINFWQNFCSGFFVELNIPYLQTELFSPAIIQETRLSLAQPTSQRLWQKHGLGDIALLFGVARNYQETEYLDYIDGSIELGVLFPTGKIKNPFTCFDFAYGYGGHYGVPLVVDISAGVYNWLTVGFHIDSVFLLGKMRRHSHASACCGVLPDQSSCISQCASSSLPVPSHPERNLNRWGNITCGSAYLKADHLFQGLSFAFGFSHARKNNRDPRQCIDSFAPVASGSEDLSLHRWSMTTFHLFLEYDLSQPDTCIGPRVAFIYNKPFRGKRIWRTATKGGDITVDVLWEF